MAKRSKPGAGKRAHPLATFKFPVVTGYPAVFPLPIDDFLCPWCREHSVGEPNSMAMLSGGAISPTGKIAKKLSGYLWLQWHGAHPQEGGKGPDPHIGTGIMLAEQTHEGQFEFYFCSTACLRAFLNFCVDELESEIANERRQRRRAKPRLTVRRE